MLSFNQKLIIALITEKGGEATKSDAVDLLGGQYFCNEDKHVGDILSRMVNRGLIQRVKPGVFRLGVENKKNVAENAENQLNLF